MERGHLDNEALIRASYGVPDPDETAHLAACAECAAALAALDGRRRRFASHHPADAVEQLPQAFWQRQRQAILAAVQQPAAPALRPVAVALSLAMLLLVAVLVVGRAPQIPATAQVPSPPAVSFRAEDEELLRDIHFLLIRVEPRALAPAALLLPDRNKEVQQQ